MNIYIPIFTKSIESLNGKYRLNFEVKDWNNVSIKQGDTLNIAGKKITILSTSIDRVNNRFSFNCNIQNDGSIIDLETAFKLFNGLSISLISIERIEDNPLIMYGIFAIIGLLIFYFWKKHK